LEIRLNGALLGGDAWSLPLPLDPGSYEVSATAPGKPAWLRRVALKAGEEQEIVVDMTTPLPPLPPPPPPPPPHPAQATGSWSQRETAYVAGGVGIAGLALGVASGAAAWATKENCPCNSGQIDSNIAARGTWATLSNIGFGVGIAGVGLATVLWFTAKPSTRKTSRPATPMRVQAALGREGIGLAIGAAF
jgi:hypothetical protein